MPSAASSRAAAPTAPSTTYRQARAVQATGSAHNPCREIEIMFINASTESISVATDWTRAPLERVEALARYPVALIGDIQHRMGMMASAIRPMTRHARFFGTILPVLTREGDNLAIHRALDEAVPGDVLVINGHTEVNRAVFGDLLAEICLARGIAGVVIDGAVRDVDEIEALGLPVFRSEEH